VVFVDFAKWDAFFQMAARIRKKGYRVVRISTAQGLHHRLVSRLVFHRFIELGGPEQLRDLPSLLEGDNIVDVQTVETLSGHVSAGLGLCVPNELRRSLVAQQGFVDKLEAAAYMRQCGACVPDQVPLGTTTAAASLVAQLGLPVVIKPRVGASGAGVQVATTVGQLERALEDVKAVSTSCLAERFVAGTQLSYGAIVGPRGVEQEILTRGWHRQITSRGPLVEHETVDDAELVNICRKVACVEGYRGPVQIDVLKDADSTHWLHDLNFRFWGGAGAALAAGVDFSEGFLNVLGLEAGAPSCRSPKPGIRYTVFPANHGEELSQGHPIRAIGCFAHAARPYAKWLGASYVVCEAFSSAFLVHYLWREARRAQRSTASGAGAASGAASKAARRHPPSRPLDLSARQERSVHQPIGGHNVPAGLAKGQHQAQPGKQSHRPWEGHQGDHWHGHQGPGEGDHGPVAEAYEVTAPGARVFPREPAS
jgi:hypothetical protein